MAHITGCLALASLMAGLSVKAQEERKTAGIQEDILGYITAEDDRVCQGDSARAYLTFVGTGPWDAVISNTEGEYKVLTGLDSPATVWLRPEATDTFYIASVVDGLGNTGTGQGTVPVEVLEVTPVSIAIDRTAYLKSEPGIPLISNPRGGEFTGNGVSGSTFYPSIASPAGSPHTIRCTFTNLLGCRSSSSVDLHVLHGEGDVALVAGSDTITRVCDNTVRYEIRGSNLDEIPGTFSLLSEEGTVPGHILDADPDDDTASFDPTGLSGTYQLLYTYSFRELDVVLTKTIQISDLASLGIVGFPNRICSNDPPYLLEPDIAEDDPGAVYTITGPGITGNREDGFYYDPGSSEAPAGNNTITLEYSASTGCSIKTDTVVRNNFTPSVDFDFDPLCLPDNGGDVSFSNLTTGKFAVEQWSWDFGDPGSGDANRSSQEEPVHFYGQEGLYEVTLTASTPAGCVDTHREEAALSGQPEADFTWLHDCYREGGSVSFVDRSATAFAEMDTFIWTFRTLSGGILGSIGTGSSVDTVRFPFASVNSYRVDLKIRNSSGCSDEVSKEIHLKPTIPFTAEGYTEDFNGPLKSWNTHAEGSPSSWILGEPEFAGLDPGPGDLAWYTDLPAGDTSYLEHSWVESPCFDLGDTRRPQISLDLARSLLPGKDGAVIQYNGGTGRGWQTLGDKGEGINWYNMDNLDREPGGSSSGWGLPVFEPDTGWIRATHDLSMLAGNPHARLRVVLATGARLEIGNQGFAFDNVALADRNRVSLLEHFTNASSREVPGADAAVDAFAAGHRGEVIDLQYHTDFPGADPMNASNPYPADVRSFFYGIYSVPFAVFNGGADPGHRFDFSGPQQEPDAEVLKSASGELLRFKMEIQADWNRERLEGSASVTCIADGFEPYLQLYLAVIETSVTAYTGENLDTLFRNVVLGMLPNPAGILLKGGWSSGDTETRSFEWPYPDYIEDPEDLAVVAFVQDRQDGKVLQVAADYVTPQVGITLSRDMPAEMVLFPNPAGKELFVSTGNKNRRAGRLQVVDLSGRIRQEMVTRDGVVLYRMDVGELAPGVYMVRLIESGHIRGRARFLIAR